jgi:hypothetical protein
MRMEDVLYSGIFRALTGSTLLVGIMMAPMTASAETFDHTGNAYSNGTTAKGGFPGFEDESIYGSHLTGSIAFDATVTSNFTGTVGATDILSWSLASAL